MRYYKLGTLAVLFCMILSLKVYAENNTYKIYVSKAGTSGGDGSIEKPLSSIYDAQKKLQNIIGTDDAKNGIDIIFREGTYVLDKTVELTSEISGTADEPITYKAYNGEKVIFTTAKNINTSRFKLVTDPNILARIPEEGRGKVYCLSLSEQNISDYGYIRLNAMNQGANPSSAIILINDEMAQMAAWPNNGAFTKVTQVYPYNGWGHDFSMQEDRLSRWATAEDAYVYGQFAYDYADDMAPIKELNPKNHRLITGRAFEFGVKAGGEFRTINLLEELDMPSEYYLNRNNGMLYYYPKEGTDITKSKMQLVTSEITMFNMNKANFNHFENLIFEGTCGSVFNMVSSNDNLIYRCEVRNIGLRAIYINNGCRNGISECNFHDVGKGVLQIKGGDKVNLTKSENYIKNCNMENFTAIGKKYVEAIRLFGIGDTVSHNRIHNSGHAAINFGGNLNTIEYNDIYDVTTESGDAGIIYAGGCLTWGGTVIRYNYIHDGVQQGYWGRGGVYLDDLMTGIDIYGNIFANINAVIALHAAKYNNFKNNICFNINGVGIRTGGTHLSATVDAALKVGKAITDAYNNGTLRTNPVATHYTSFYKQIWDVADKYNTDVWYRYFPYLRPENIFSRNNFVVAFDNQLTNNITICDKNHYLEPLPSQKTRYEKIGKKPDDGAVDCILKNNCEIVDDPANYVIDAENGNYNLKNDSLLKKYLDYSLYKDFKFPKLEDIGIEGENKLTLKNFNLLSPEEKQENVNASDVVLCWEDTSGADKYRLIVATDKDFNNIILNKVVFNPYYRFRDLEFGMKTYYWKVEGIASPWQFGTNRTIWNANGVHCFRTAAFEKINKIVLIDLLKSANDQYKSTTEGKDPGQSKTGARENLISYITSAEKVNNDKKASRKEVENAASRLKKGIEIFEGNKNPEDLDIAQLIKDSKNWVRTTITGSTVTIAADKSGGYNGDILKRHHILKFKAKFKDLSDGYTSIGLRANSVVKFPWETVEYIFLVKKDKIELQKFNGKFKFFYDVDNTFIKQGKDHLISYSALTEENGVRIKLEVDNKEVFNILDTENYIETNGNLHIFNSGRSFVELKPYEE